MMKIILILAIINLINCYKIVIFVLGCNIEEILQNRINTALTFANKYDGEIVWYLSGGIKDKVYSNTKTEATKMKNLIKEKNNWSFKLDSKAKNTAENFLNFQQWIQENFFDKVYISTSKFHYTRANAILKEINNSSNYNWLLADLDYQGSFNDELIHSKNIISDVEKAINRFYEK